MNKLLRSRMMRSLIPYFTLGVMLIITFRLVSEFGFFATHLGHFWSIISPFITGAIIAYILNLPCSAIQRGYDSLGNFLQERYGRFGFITRKSRALSVLSLILLIIGLIALALTFIIPPAYRSILQFIEEFPSYIVRVEGWLATAAGWDLPAFLQELLPDPGYDGEVAFMAWLGDMLQNFEFDGVFAGVIDGLGGAAMALFHFFIALVSAIYILVEKDNIRPFARKVVYALFKEKTADAIMKYSNKLNTNFHQYIRVQTIDGIILGTIMIIVLMIFGSPYALILGLILGIVNYIPYFGSIFGTAFAVVVVAFSQDIPTAALAAVIMFAIQQFDGNFIQPKLMGGSFRMSPLLIIISVTIGGAYAGIFGMLIAIPIAAILKEALADFLEYRKRKNDEPPPEEDPYYYG
jgi:predicted PurR-regulated permease PerM